MKKLQDFTTASKCHAGAKYRRLFAMLGLMLPMYAVPVSAHEFWIEPNSFQPKAGGALDVRVLVGQDFRGDGVVYLPETIERFMTVTARGKQSVLGVPGDDPAARLTPAEPGLMFIVYQSTRYSLTMDAASFDDYLKKEGLDGIRALRGKNDKPVSEVYTRCVKSLLAVGGRSDGLDFSQPVGLRLEIVPLSKIYRRERGREVEVQLLYENRPLAGVQIEAFSKKKLKARLVQRTDRKGRTRFVLPHEGVWLLNAVHMIPAPASANADWESFWASFTFEL